MNAKLLKYVLFALLAIAMLSGLTAHAQDAPPINIGETWKLVDNVNSRQDSVQTAATNGRLLKGTEIVVEDLMIRGSAETGNLEIWVYQTNTDLDGWVAVFFEDGWLAEKVNAVEAPAADALIQNQPEESEELGVPLATIEQIIAENPEVSDSILALDTLWNEQWNALGIADDWTARMARDGYVIPGEAVLWTNFYEELSPLSLPDGLTALNVEGNYGVYYVALDAEFPIPTKNAGGRWIMLGSLPTEPEISCQELVDIRNDVAGLEREAVRQYMDEQRGRVYLNKSESVAVDPNDALIFWGDWNGEVPTNVFALTDLSTSGGYGVWVVYDGVYETPASGGILLLDCE